MNKMISEDEKHDLIWSSINFMGTISKIYGPDKGMELWSSIADNIDPELKGLIFMHMLTGTHNSSKFMVRNPVTGRIEDRVGLIRCLRTYDRRRLGLKEAKDLVDNLDNGGSIFLEVDPQINPTFKAELHKFNLVA
jgi:hypothetical protein